MALAMHETSIAYSALTKKSRNHPPLLGSRWHRPVWAQAVSPTTYREVFKALHHRFHSITTPNTPYDIITSHSPQRHPQIHRRSSLLRGWTLGAQRRQRWGQRCRRLFAAWDQPECHLLERQIQKAYMRRAEQMSATAAQEQLLYARKGASPLLHSL